MVAGMGRHARQERHVPAFLRALTEAIPPRGVEAMYAPTSPIGRAAAREIDLRDVDLRQRGQEPSAGPALRGIAVERSQPATVTSDTR